MELNLLPNYFIPAHVNVIKTSVQAQEQIFKMLKTIIRIHFQSSKR